MHIHCRRRPDGLYVARSDLGDVLEFEMTGPRDGMKLRLAGPPQWRSKPRPPDAPAIATAARAAVRDRARSDGFGL